MAAGVTYTPIASTVLSSSQPGVTFSSISASYTDLVLVCDGAATGQANYELRFNSDTASNYSRTFLTGNSGGASSNSAASQTFIRCDFGGNLETTFGQGVVIDIMNYSNTSVNKTIISRSGGTSGVGGSVGMWRSTAAISTIDVIATGVNYISGSTFCLYGIVRA